MGSRLRSGIPKLRCVATTIADDTNFIETEISEPWTSPTAILEGFMTWDGKLEKV
jgi:hypothetical protein